MRIDVDDFKILAKGTYLEKFSEEALEAIFEYYEEFDDVQYDPVSFSCAWTEYAEEEEMIGDYGYLVDDDEDDDDGEGLLQKIVNELEERTIVRELTKGGYLIQDF